MPENGQPLSNADVSRQKIYTLYGQKKSSDETKEFYDSYTKRIQGKHNRHALLLKYIPSGSRALDFGCGWGVFSKMIFDKGCSVLGIDIDPESIKIAKDFSGEKQGLSFAAISIGDLEAESFDIVISNQVVEHVFNPGNHIKECNRVLKKGGHLILSTPNVINPYYFYYQISPNVRENLMRISSTIKSYNKTHEHVQSWEAYNLCRLLCALGFSYMDHEFMEGIPFPKIGTFRIPIPLIKNLSYTMMLKMRKETFVDIGNND